MGVESVNAKPKPRILVCIPAFKAETVAEIINKSKKYADEIIIYDNGSMDNTHELA